MRVIVKLSLVEHLYLAWVLFWPLAEWSARQGRNRKQKVPPNPFIIICVNVTIKRIAEKHVKMYSLTKPAQSTYVFGNVGIVLLYWEMS